MFLPVLLILYFCLAVLEDSGYMARAAFVMDRLMQLLGLHGKSFIPLIVGFGCNVPGILATRTLENRRDRVLTGLLVPLMSCAARLPVYVIFAAAFFPRHAGAVIFWLYLLGIVLAVLSGLLFRRTLFAKTGNSLFVLELPPYRLPALRGLTTHMWRHSEEFVRKAATVILAASVIVWVLLNLPLGVTDTADSLFGRVAGAVAPVFEPLGFGNWQATGALATGLVAKEIVVSSMSVIYQGGEPAAPPEPIDLAADLRGIVVGFGQAVIDSARIVLSLIPGVNLVGPQAGQADTRPRPGAPAALHAPLRGGVPGFRPALRALRRHAQRAQVRVRRQVDGLQLCLPAGAGLAVWVRGLSGWELAVGEPVSRGRAEGGG